MSFGERFLTRPDLFPARLSGEPWGGEARLLDVAGGPYLLDGLHPEQAEALQGRYGPFLHPGGSSPVAPARCQVFRASGHDFRPVPTRGWHYEPDQDPGPRRVRLAGLGLIGLLAERSGVEGALWTPHPGGEAFLGACENFLRLQIAYRLLGLGGLLLHSAGLVLATPPLATPPLATPGGGAGVAVLAGPSGAGKSTASRLALAGGWGVLSDDLNALLPAPGPAGVSGGFAVHPLPLAGELGRLPGSADSLPLCRLCWLEKGEEVGLRPLGPGAAVAALLTCAPGINRDPAVLPAVTALLARLTAAHPVVALRFRRDGEFLDLLASGARA